MLQEPPPRSRAVPEKRAPLARGPLVYYLLAAFDVLAVSASLYLNHRIMGIYVRSVAANHEWAARAADYSALGQLAARVNAPGNDVFDSGDVARETARLEQALQDFDRRLAALRGDLGRSVAPEDARRLARHMGELEPAMGEMVAEARQTLAHVSAGHSARAAERMAAMDRRYAKVLAAVRGLNADVAAIQRREFVTQTAAAATLQRFEYVIAGLILVMVAAATAYGRRLARQSAHDARERAAYTASLQAAEESLRRAHSDLEQRVEERTEALARSEAALRRSAEEWRQTFEAIESPLIVLDADERVLRLNRAALLQAGLQEDRALDRSVSALASGEPWQAAARAAASVRRRRAAETVEARDAQEGRTWHVSANLVPDGDGRGSERIIIVARDVTRLVELQESVRREERMAAMGSLVGGVAHEVRNPLFGISSTVDALEARHGENEALGKYIQVLRREADRLADLMRDLLDYGKPPRLERAATDCDAVVDEAIRACEPLARSLGGQVVREGNWAGRQACIDRWRVTQCLQNLVQNALQHAPAGTPVVVGSALVIDDGREWVTCSVRDRGPGIPPDDLPRLFEPFFSRRSGGTGLGLSIALRVASQHGGRLEAYNHPSGGAVTRLILPVSAPAQNA